MAKKSAKDFSANPFKQLKGFVVSDAEKKQAAVSKAAEAAKQEVPPADEPVDFLQEMAALGVKPEADRRRTVIDEVPTVKKAPTPAARPKTDEEVFLNALGEMDVCFKDELPEDEQEALSKSNARRIKQLRQGKLVPEAKLDLHGEVRHVVRDKVRFFLEDATHQGHKTVLIITGRGNNSPDGPVLRDEAERYLRLDAKKWVVEWSRAPRNYGGEGALVVFLR